MAQTRAQRRRRTLFLTIALVATLLVLLFARDVSRSAHGAIGTRRSENRSFAALANVVITQENQLDGRLYFLLSKGQSLDRPVFAARLDQLGEELPTLVTESEQLRRPKLAHSVNDVAAELFELRIDAYQALLDDVATTLSLPAPATLDEPTPLANPAQTLFDTSSQWALDRYALVHEPGRARLDALAYATAKYYLAAGLDRLTSSSSLALTRGIGIVAVSVAPAPLPAATGVLLLPPVGSVHLGVSVENASYVVQPVVLTVTLTPLNGREVRQSQTLRVTLGPLASYAFVARDLATQASERARLVLSLSGAPSGPTLTRTRSYLVEMSPSGTG